MDEMGTVLDEQQEPQAEEGGLETMIRQIVQQEVRGCVPDVWPVGSIYITVQPENPGDYLGGTWEAWGRGRMPVGVDMTQGEFSMVEYMGGNKMMQAHSHGIPALSGKATGGAHTHAVLCGTGAQVSPTAGKDDCLHVAGAEQGAKLADAYRAAMTATHTHTFTMAEGETAVAGSGNAQNLPPYITCYMWKRVEEVENVEEPPEDTTLEEENNGYQESEV